MNEKNNRFSFDEENEDIVEYLERDLEEVSSKYLSGESTKNRKRTGRNRDLDELDKKQDEQPLRKSPKEKKNKSSVLRVYEANKLKILWSVFGVLVIILLITLIVTNFEDESEDAQTTTVEETEAETQEQTTEAVEEEALLAQPADSKYNVLFEKYFNSTYVQWNKEAVTQCFENMQNVSSEKYEYLNKYIESVENIVCYVGYETEDGKQLVYVTFNMKFQNIETRAPFMEAYILVEGEDGYKIHNFEVGEELDYYTSHVKDSKAYTELISSINEQLGIALENDPDLKNVYEILKNMSN